MPEATNGKPFEKPKEAKNALRSPARRDEVGLACNNKTRRIRSLQAKATWDSNSALPFLVGKNTRVSNLQTVKPNSASCLNPQTSRSTFVVGHQRPDTVSAVVYAALLNALSDDETFEGVVLGELSGQTKWLFAEAGVLPDPLPPTTAISRMSFTAV